MKKCNIQSPLTKASQAAKSSPPSLVECYFLLRGFPIPLQYVLLSPLQHLEVSQPWAQSCPVTPHVYVGGVLGARK